MDIYEDHCPPNRVWLDQCDETLAFVKLHPGTTALQVGGAVYPWAAQNPDRAKAEATRTAFARRRLDTLVDAGLVAREMDRWTCCYRATTAATS